MWKLLFACRNHSCACLNRTRVCCYHISACQIHTACRNYTLRTEITFCSWNCTPRVLITFKPVVITLVCVIVTRIRGKITLVCVKITLCGWKLHNFFTFLGRGVITSINRTNSCVTKPSQNSDYSFVFCV
jgi:hypothetical protein